MGDNLDVLIGSRPIKLDDKYKEELVKENILNILKEKYLNNTNFVSKNKKKIEFEHINKSKEEILKENIAKIKDFVPYEPILINKGRKKL